MKVSAQEITEKKIVFELDATEACGLLEDLNFIHYHSCIDGEKPEALIYSKFQELLKKTLDELNIV